MLKHINNFTCCIVYILYANVMIKTMQEATKQYLTEKRIMQLATVQDDQPWICTVYFVADENQNIYWLSLPSRRHSLELAAHNKAAAAIAVKTDMPVTGIQIEGEVSIVTEPAEVKRIMEIYVAAHGGGKDYYNNFVTRTAQHSLYKLTPKNIVLFDEFKFPETPRQEWKIN